MELSQSARLKQKVGFGANPRSEPGRERLCFFPLPGSAQSDAAASLVPLLKECLDRALRSRWTAFNEELRRLEHGRGNTGWNFGEFFIAKCVSHTCDRLARLLCAMFHK